MFLKSFKMYLVLICLCKITKVISCKIVNLNETFHNCIIFKNDIFKFLIFTKPIVSIFFKTINDKRILLFLLDINVLYTSIIQSSLMSVRLCVP